MKITNLTCRALIPKLTMQRASIFNFLCVRRICFAQSKRVDIGLNPFNNYYSLIYTAQRKNSLNSSNIGEKMKAKIGDILEVPTKKGIAYVQYTHEDEYGGVVRVLRGIFDQSLQKDNLCRLATQPHEFTAIIPVTAAVSRKIFKVAAHCDIPEFAKSHPIFRSSKGEYEDYMLWDGEKEWSKDELSEGEKKFPILSIWNDTLLAERIADGWRPEKEFE